MADEGRVAYRTELDPNDGQWPGDESDEEIEAALEWLAQAAEGGEHT